jgi:general secretion pathway protein G
MKAGFTLVEILIVVVILGILAAIVIPQFTEASSDAKLSSLTTDLQTVRAQLELYKIQHNDQLPLHGTSDAFWDCLTKPTNLDGSAGDGTDDFGPYLQKAPSNPFVVDTTVDDVVEIETTNDGLGGGNAGWHLNTSDNSFHADTDAHIGY